MPWRNCCLAFVSRNVPMEQPKLEDVYRTRHILRAGEVLTRELPGCCAIAEWGPAAGRAASLRLDVLTPPPGHWQLPGSPVTFWMKVVEVGRQQWSRNSSMTEGDCEHSVRPNVQQCSPTRPHRRIGPRHHPGRWSSEAFGRPKKLASEAGERKWFGIISHRRLAR